MHKMKIFLVRTVGAYVVVLFAILLLPVFLVSDNVDIFQHLIDYINSPDSWL